MVSLDLFTVEASKIVFIYVMLFIVSIAFLILLFVNDAKKESFQKLIGGLTVFMVAVISNEPAVYFLSLFIGGLIIASEEFMKFIFAVWKSDPSTIAKTIQSFTEATPSEVEEKNKEEIESITKTEKIRNSEVQGYSEKSKDVEAQVQKMLENIYAGSYIQELKVNNEYGSMVFDGAIVSTKHNPSMIFTKEELSKRNDISLEYGVEIKFMRDLASTKWHVKKMLERISFYNFVLSFKLVLVVQNIDMEDAKGLQKELSDLYANRHEFSFHIYTYVDGTVKPLLP